MIGNGEELKCGVVVKEEGNQIADYFQNEPIIKKAVPRRKGRAESFRLPKVIEAITQDMEPERSSVKPSAQQEQKSVYSSESPT